MTALESLRRHPGTATLADAVEARLRRWDDDDCTKRLWDGDATLWTGRDESSWLGWLQIVEQQLAALEPLRRLQDDARRGGFEHVLLLGMGGSSLFPEVLALTFGTQPGFPRMSVLDSTDPAQVRAHDEACDPARTLYIVASKSGSTLEPSIFKSYFFDRCRSVLHDDAGTHFVAITDPGSKLEQEARADRFRAILPGLKSIGGRYSALSNFGMVPAALQGLDFEHLLRGAADMARACAPGVAAGENPGVLLGAILGVGALRGRDKLTVVASPGIAPFGAWLEQLVAESTGKQGHGIVPVDLERLGGASVYGGDRLFVYLRLESAPDPMQDAAMSALSSAGQPVVRLEIPNPWAIGAECFRWEFATAVAGAVIGIHPFDQPDVEASKIETRALTDAYERTGTLPEEAPFLTSGDIALLADAKNVAALDGTRRGARTLAAYLRAHLDRLGAGDYFALLAYIHMNVDYVASLQATRLRVRDARRVATCLGFGPRFLHSTGQAYKGGPNSGVFLQITCSDGRDLPVPGQRYTFGVVKAAQARGDFEVLAERGRRALRIHLRNDVAAGLRALDIAVAEALAQ